MSEMPEFVTVLVAAAAATAVSWLLSAKVMKRLPKWLVPAMLVPLAGALAAYLGTLTVGGELSGLAVAGLVSFLHQFQDQLKKAARAWRAKDRLPRVGDPERIAPGPRLP